MKLANLFTDSRNADELLMHTVQALAARVDELEELLNRECKQNETLDELLMSIGANVEVGHSDYSKKDYLSLGYIDADDRYYQELFDYWNLRKEEEKCEATN